MPNTPPRLIESVLAHALELRDQGAVDWLERATADFPELRDRIARAAGETEAVATWFTEGRTSDPHLGRVLGERFRLSRRIGAGAMGVVYVAEDQQLMREVAVKVLRGGLVDLEHSLERLLRESEAMAAVQHPSLITVHDRGQTEDGSPYLVMEWLDGQPLSVLLDEAAERAEATGHPTTHWLVSEHGIDARGETSFARLAVSWIADIANGMTQVHTAGVLHRDIKPSNIVVKRDGSAVLLDFGLALLDEDSTLTRGATSIGTPAYMPPESLAGARTRKPSGDIYSLTATLYHLLALRAPYQGAPHEVLAALAMAEPEPANKLRPGLPRDLQAILEKGMQRRAHDRYPSMAALEADLRAYLDLRPVSVRPLSPLGRTWRRARRSRLAQGIAVALLAVGLVLGGRALKAHHDARLHAAAAEVRAALPPNLTTVMPAFRRYAEPADRAQVAALLDRGVELGVDELVMRSLRASFRIDNGEARAAAEDMAWIAGALDSPFGRALLDRYRALPTDATHDPDLAGLPEPTSAGDEYVLATLLLRAERYAEADALLAHEGVRAMWHGEELRLMGVAFGGLTIPERIERARAALAAVDALEQRLGGRTAATAHIGGRFQTIMERPRTAYAWLAEGVALSAPSHVLENNAGFAAFQLGDLEAARTHYGRAVALRPSYPKSLEGLLYVHVAEHDFAEARALLAEAPVADEVWRLRHLAFVEVQAALEFQRRAEPAAMQAAMGAAREHLSRAEQLAGAPLSDTQAAILAGLESGDAEGVFLALAAFVLEDSARTWAVRHLLDHMPADLDAEGTAAMRALFERTQSLEGLRSNL